MRAVCDELVDTYERAIAALERARAGIDAEFSSLRAQYDGADPAGKADLAKDIHHLELRAPR